MNEGIFHTVFLRQTGPPVYSKGVIRPVSAFSCVRLPINPELSHWREWEGEREGGGGGGGAGGERVGVEDG